jgi:glycosyltransferase involved in cell wall biosynthesis
MKILMISYYYPPLLDVGCKRSVAFSKFLKKHGWEPIVLSVKNPDKHYCRTGNDQPPQGISIIYTWSLFNLSWIFGIINGSFNRIFSVLGGGWQRNFLHDLFSIPDLFVGWIPGATASGLNLIKKHDIQCIYVSCSPFSSAIAGMALKKITGKPLVIDFRDPFALRSSPGIRVKINRWIEKNIIASADKFVVNTEEVRNRYITTYPTIAEKTVTIHNGFDHELLPQGEYKKFDIFTITYAGNMYFNIMQPIAFFEAVKLLKTRGIIHKENFRFMYYGSGFQRVEKMAEKWDITDLTQAEPSISHPEMLTVIKKSHLQLLRIIKPMISTKLFEGLALNIPFLATIPEGEVADLITRYSPSSQIVSEDSPQEIADAIVLSMDEYRHNTIQDNLVDDFLEKFSREEMTRKLEAVIKELI